MRASARVGELSCAHLMQTDGETILVNEFLVMKPDWADEMKKSGVLKGKHYGRLGRLSAVFAERKGVTIKIIW